MINMLNWYSVHWHSRAPLAAHLYGYNVYTQVHKTDHDCYTNKNIHDDWRLGVLRGLKLSMGTYT